MEYETSSATWNGLDAHLNAQANLGWELVSTYFSFPTVYCIWKRGRNFHNG